VKDGLIHDAEILHSVLDVHRDEIAAVICASVVKNACAMPAPRCLQVTARRMHQTQACLTAAADAPQLSPSSTIVLHPAFVLEFSRHR
jgi:hypothetical protein